MKNRFITIKDIDGVIRPKAYLERIDVHEFAKKPKLEEGESFIEIEVSEVISNK